MCHIYCLDRTCAAASFCALTVCYCYGIYAFTVSCRVCGIVMRYVWHWTSGLETAGLFFC